MRRLLALTAVVFFVAAGNASAATFDCFGPPADYVTKYDQVRGQLKNGKVGYPEKRFYIEYQSWLTPNGEPAGHHSEHLHWGACVPQGTSFGLGNGQNHIDIMFKFHNVIHYKVVDIAGSFVTQNGSLGAFSPAARAAAIPPLDAAMQQSGGLATTTEFASFQVQPTQTNGRKEARMGITVERNGPDALVETWKLNGRWYMTDNYAGLPTVLPKTDQVSFIRMRTIVETFNASGQLRLNYHHAGFANSFGWDRDLVQAVRPASWDVDLHVTDGGGPASVEINPNHHVHPDVRGPWFADLMMFSGAGQASLETVTVPLGPLNLSPTKVHRLVFLSHDQPECTRAGNPCPPGVRPDWTDVTILPFKAP